MPGIFNKIINVLSRVFQILIPDEETARQMAERYAPYFRSLEIETKNAEKLERLKKDNKQEAKNLYRIKQEEKRELVTSKK
ncbi:MAG: hypothetical protein PHI06_14880 [Desulfobulbaceae bacterium]|jgi:hypothetical protein|nr:hypothetical protein [Desulfobulbaceae bacterium]